MNQNAINFETKTVTISLAEYERFKATQKTKDVADRKKTAGQNFFVRRQALVLRRVNQEEIAPDNHVLAFDSVYTLKKEDHEAKGTFEEKMKIPVSEEEIQAFLALEEEGVHYEEIRLAQVQEKVARNKEAKKGASRVEDLGESTLEGESTDDEAVIED